MNDEYINAAFQKIIELQQQAHGNPNPAMNQGICPSSIQNPEQLLEQTLVNTVLNPIKLKTTGQYYMDTRSNEVPLMEVQEGTIINDRGYIEEVKKEVFYPLDDGTSLGGVAECMNCGSTVKLENLHRCTCGKTCCVLCGNHSTNTNQWFCSWWHQFLD